MRPVRFPMPAPDAPSPLSRPAFLHFLCARVGASLAFQIVSVAVGWQVYELSGSALDLGLIGLAQFLPMAALTQNATGSASNG